MSKHSRAAAEISRIMRRVASSDTAPEQGFRRALWKRGYRYRICPDDVPGKPDLVLPRHRTAIFVDGDFWHGNQWRLRGLTCLEDQFPATANRGYWLNKIRRNMTRDCRVTRTLTEQGWKVFRFWESDIKRNAEGCVDMVVKSLRNGNGKTSGAGIVQKTFAEYFAGIGLMRMGLEGLGWRGTFANDIDPIKEAMYQTHFGAEDEVFVREDIHTLEPSRIPPATLATASFPCNDLSLAGNRSGLNGVSSSAFWGFVRILKAQGKQKPPILLIENVAGFLTSHRGKDFESACTALNDLGYSVDPFILNAANFVPQSRLRLFIVAVSTSLQTPAHVKDEASFYESAVRPKALADFIFRHPKIDWNLRPLPDPPRAETKLEDVLEDLPHTSEEWWSSERAAYLLNQMSPRHRAIADKMIKGRKWRYGTVFRRIRHGKSMAELRTDGIAGCLRTPRGGSGRQILFKAGKGKYMARLLTPRECARLMGADDYVIETSRNNALFGFGDAVCVPVIEWIAQYYLDPLVNELIRGRMLICTPAAAVTAGGSRT